MKATDLKGMSVLSINEGSRLWVIHDLLFDADTLRVAALTTQADGKTRLIPFDGITSLGDDAVTVESTHVTRLASDRSPRTGLRSVEALIGLKVVDAAGTLLGKVEELEIDPDNGRLMELVVHQGGILGIGGSTEAVPGVAVRSLGPEVVVVEPAFVPLVDA